MVTRKYYIKVALEGMAEDYLVTAASASEAREKALAEFRSSFGISEVSSKRIRSKVRIERVGQIAEKSIRVL